MVLGDFLSRQKTDDSNPHEIISISFSLRKGLCENYYKLDILTETTEIDKYMVQTRSQTKLSGMKVPEVHGVDKGLILHVKPEHQKSVVTTITHQTQPIDKEPPTSIVRPMPKPRIGQGRAGIRRQSKVALATPKPIQTPALPILTPAPRTVQSFPEPMVQSQERTLPQHHIPTVSQPIVHPNPINVTKPIGPSIEHRLIPPCPDPFLSPPPRPPDVTDLKDTRKDLLDLDTDRNIKVEESSPHQEGIISETYERLGKSYIQEPSELKDLVDTTKSVQKCLPKQTDIDKILDIIKRKVLKGTHLPLSIREIQAGYLTSPYFKDLYLYLAQKKLPSKRSVICKVENLTEKFILLDLLLFKVVTNLERETELLAVPEICADKITMLYHTSLFAGH